MNSYTIIADQTELIEIIRTCVDESVQKLSSGSNAPISPTKEVMTVDEVAEYLRVKPQTIYNYKNEGKIPYTKKISLRFLKVEIDKWLMEQ